MHVVDLMEVVLGYGLSSFSSSAVVTVSAVTVVVIAVVVDLMDVGGLLSSFFSAAVVMASAVMAAVVSKTETTYGVRKKGPMPLLLAPLSIIKQPFLLFY